MSGLGLRSQVGTASPPYTEGPYIWDQQLAFGGSYSAGLISTSNSTAVQTSVDGFKLFTAALTTTATTNVNSERTAYIRLYLSGVGSGGEAARIFSEVYGVAASNVHGAHVSLSLYNGSSSVTGEGIAMRGQLELPNASIAGGTYTATQAEIYSDGSSTAFSGTQLSLFRAVLGGNATGITNIDQEASLIALDGFAIGSGHILATSSTTVTHSIRCLVNGTPLYLMASTSA